MIRAPAFLKALLGGDRPAPRPRAYGTAFPARAPNEPQSANAARGWSSGFGGSTNWGGRGPGQRLGGD